MISAARYRALALTVAVVLISGCVTSTERGTDSGTFALSPGETVYLADGTDVRYHRVSSDSRCRPEVQCVWAGRAEIQLRITPPFRIPGAVSATDELLLSTDLDASRTYAGWRYRLVKLGFEPEPSATLQVDPASSHR